jgi:bla regulator protein blaR1
MAVIDARSADEIELILAHELMHVRRGDLWMALLRWLALSLWWFHPLVWWAARRASREAERCCDDAVLAELRCSPTRYARCLLNILEIKHRLSHVPLFPGVRAIEINQGRLERIMKIGHRGYRRAPWWTWSVVLLTAIAVLPGAAMVMSADEGPEVAYQATSPESVPYPLDANAAPTNSGLGAGVSALGNKMPPDTAYYTKAYSVKDVLFKLRKENGYSEPAAKKDLAQFFVRNSIANSMAGPAGNQRTCPQPEQVRWLKDSDDLVVGATNAGHKRVADTLDALRKYGTLDQIAIETRFVTIPDDELQQVLPDWSPLTVDEAALASSNAVWPASFDRPLDSHEGMCVARAQLLTEKNPPVRFRIMNKDQGEKLIERCQNNTRSNMLQAPKVTVFNGQTACVSDIAQSPFVVGVAPVEGQEATGARQPQTRVVSEGTMLQLRPIADQSGTIHLDFAATFSKIQKVDTVNFTPASTNGTTLQIPEVATVCMEGGAALKPGQWLLLGGSDMTNQMTATKVAPVSWKDWLLGGGKRQKPPQTQELFLMLRADKVATSREAAESNRQ